jgi:ERF superfamily
VIQAIAMVMRDLPGIAKKKHDNDGQSGVSYAYRGIEEITAEAQGLFAKYGVVFVPRVISRDVKDLTINSRPWTEEHLEVVYTVYGPGERWAYTAPAGGYQDQGYDCIEVGPIHALGRDNSDKGCNKAMTQAFKYALLQVLCIGDSKDDGDKETHVADERPKVQQIRAEPDHAARNEAVKALQALKDDGVVSVARAKELWALYGQQDEDKWYHLLQMELNRHQEAEHPSEPTNISDLQERAQQAQQAQRRTRPAPGTDAS